MPWRSHSLTPGPEHWFWWIWTPLRTQFSDCDTSRASSPTLHASLVSKQETGGTWVSKSTSATRPVRTSSWCSSSTNGKPGRVRSQRVGKTQQNGSDQIAPTSHPMHSASLKDLAPTGRIMNSCSKVPSRTSEPVGLSTSDLRSDLRSPGMPSDYPRGCHHWWRWRKAPASPRRTGMIS